MPVMRGLFRVLNMDLALMIKSIFTLAIGTALYYFGDDFKATEVGLYVLTMFYVVVCINNFRAMRAS